jgi:hypothetical protein
MDDAKREFMEWLIEQERQRMLNEPPRPAPQPQTRTIHYTELPADTSGGRGAVEWNFYRREVGRLLAEGHEGKWVLIKGEEIVGIWDTRDEAKAVALERFPMQDILVQQILTREPVLRGPTYWRLCRS